MVDLEKTHFTSLWTVSKIAPTECILISMDYYRISIPLTRVPLGLQEGNMVEWTMERCEAQEMKREEEFLSYQDQIVHVYGQFPEKPTIYLKTATQTSLTLVYDPLILNTSKFKEFRVYVDGNRKSSFVLKKEQCYFKLTGLSVHQSYQVCLWLVTTSGIFQSNPLTVTTLAMEDMSGVYLVFNGFEKERGEDQDQNHGEGKKEEENNQTELDRLERLAKQLGMHVLPTWHHEKEEENLDKEPWIMMTHVVCKEAQGSLVTYALQNNIPVVTQGWLEACNEAKAIQSVHEHYPHENQTQDQHR